MIRVLMVLDALLVGGTETHVLTLTQALLRSNMHVAICGADGALREKFEGLGCPVYQLTNGYPDGTSERRTMRAELASTVEREQINLIHVHQGSSGRVAAEFARRAKLPVVFTVHGLIYGTQTISDIAHRSAAVISVSPPVQTELRNMGIHSVLIANGVDTKLYHRRRHHRRARTALGIPRRGKVVLYAGRLSWEKALICKKVIKSCADLRTQFPDLHLVVAGDGFQFNDVKAEARKTENRVNARFIHCVGQRFDMTEMYAVADCVVGTGRVALEAMASWRPVVGVGSKGFFGLVTPQRMESAWQYYYGDHKSCRPWLPKYMKSDLAVALSSRGTTQNCADAGRALVKTKFCVEQVAARTARVYRTVLHRSRR